MAKPLSSKLSWELMNPILAQTLNPVIANPLNAAQVISVSLKSGANIINHGLGRTIQGWFITDINAAATVYRSAPLNSITLTLTSSAPALADIGVF